MKRFKQCLPKQLLFLNVGIRTVLMNVNGLIEPIGEKAARFEKSFSRGKTPRSFSSHTRAVRLDNLICGHYAGFPHMT